MCKTEAGISIDTSGINEKALLPMFIKLLSFSITIVFNPDNSNANEPIDTMLLGISIVDRLEHLEYILSGIFINPLPRLTLFK